MPDGTEFILYRLILTPQLDQNNLLVQIPSVYAPRNPISRGFPSHVQNSTAVFNFKLLIAPETVYQNIYLW